MARDTEQTRRRLRDAAVAEFAEHGLQGATMTQIAERAGINKERLYSYFGDKRALFRRVLADELERLSESVAGPEDWGPTAVGEYAARAFDYHVEHPELARLLLWEGLGEAGVVDEAPRTERYRSFVRRLAEAQRAGELDDAIDPAYAAFMLIALAAWWMSAPQLARMLTGTPGSAGTGAVDADELARRRAFVVLAAERLLLPRDGARPSRGETS